MVRILRNIEVYSRDCFEVTVQLHMSVKISLEILQTCFGNVKDHLTPGEHNAHWIRCVRPLEQKRCGKNYPSRVFWEIQFLKLKPLVHPFATKSVWGNHVTSSTHRKFLRKYTNIFWVCKRSSKIKKTQRMLIHVRTSSRTESCAVKTSPVGFFEGSSFSSPNHFWDHFAVDSDWSLWVIAWL